jgi:hypothetical protein
VEKKRKKVLGKFLSPPHTNLLSPYYAIALANSWPLNQKIKWQDKTLAIGSNNPISPKIFSKYPIKPHARSVLARRDEPNSQKRKTYGKNVHRKTFPKLIAESFSATVIFFLTSEN